MSPARRRLAYAILIALNVPAGLATRSHGHLLPRFVAEYGGDALSASCILFGLRFAWPRARLWRVALAAYLVCLSIELSQLYQAPWIVKLRHTWPFGILLGFGFLWSDWACYAVGVAIGWAIAATLERGRRAPGAA